MNRRTLRAYAGSCCQKDYLELYGLSGSFCTDYSDASGMLLLDMAHKGSEEMMEPVRHYQKTAPDLYESFWREWEI